MLEKYDNLYAAVITKEQHEKTCNYWYLVDNSATAHTAFTTKHGFMRWLNERNLKLTKPLTEPGVFSSQKITGSYQTESHMDKQYFDNGLQPVLLTKTLSNGDYVVAKITEDSEKIRTVHTLNPNVKERYVFNYQEASKEMR